MAAEQCDHYFDDGYLVFTTEYHLKRGYCCKNACRHCPWKKPSERELSHQKNLSNAKLNKI